MQAAALGHQLNPKVAAATVHWLEQLETADPTPQITNDTPRAKNNSPWAHSGSKITSRYEELALTAKPDNRDLGHMLVPAFGKPTTVSGVHNFKGLVPGSNTGAPYETTAYWQNPNVVDAMFGMIDGVAQSFEVTLDAGGNLRVSETLRGVPLPVDTTPSAVSYTELENSLLPFEWWTSFLQVDGDEAPWCIRTLRLRFEFNRDPHFCIPTTKWDAETDVRGGRPNRFKRGDAVATIEVTGDFPNYANSIWKQWEDEVVSPWVLTMDADPGDLEEGETSPQVVWTMPRVKWLNPRITDDGLESVEQMSGELFYDPDQLTAILIALRNKLTNYNGT